MNKLAICNELYEGQSFETFCGSVAAIGYEGVELAPFMFAPLVTQWTAAHRRETATIAHRHGLTVIGLHWLFARTSGFSIVSADPSVRATTATYLGELAQACADVGGMILVLGSPPVRNVPDGMTTDAATDYATLTLEQVLPKLESTGVTLAFLNTAAAARALAQRLAHPAVRLHLDVKAMSTEPTPIPELIHTHADLLAHFHANDPNKLGPGMGEVRFEPICQALNAVNYQGWVSVEVFDFSPGAEFIARTSFAHYRAAEKSSS
jgi:sugar phosphate isomerase/epimerase